MAHVPRLYTPGLRGPGTLVLDGDQSRRLGAVMRLRAGDGFLAFAGDGRQWSAIISSVARGTVTAEVESITRDLPRPPRMVEMGIAIVRPNRMDWAVEKCTEAGADLIRPVTTAHTARGPAVGRNDRWRRIAVEAAEQSDRVFVPGIAGVEPLATVIARAGVLVFGALDGEPWAMASRALPDEGSILGLVGPEGGFDDTEVRALQGCGGRPVRLGPNVMRTETAAVVLTALLRGLDG